MTRCKGNTIAVWGIFALGAACIGAIVYARDKDITAALSPLAGVALGGLVQFITNRGVEPQKSAEAGDTGEGG